MNRPRLRVLTWNVWGPGPHRAERLDAICAEINRHTPDVVLLQECASTVHGDDTGMAAQIAQQTGLTLAYVTDETDFDIQRAILTRLPVRSSGAIPLGVTPSRWARPTAVHATVTTDAGRTVHLVSAHLPWGGKSENLRLTAAQCIDFWAEHTVRPGELVVLGGDLNANADGAALRWLTGKGVAPDGSSTQWADAFDMAGLGDPTTVDPGNSNAADTARTHAGALDIEAIPRRRIDYILVKTGDDFWIRGRAGMPLRCQVIGTVPALTAAGPLCGSDHYGVMAELWDPPVTT